MVDNVIMFNLDPFLLHTICNNNTIRCCTYGVNLPWQKHSLHSGSPHGTHEFLAHLTADYGPPNIASIALHQIYVSHLHHTNTPAFIVIFLAEQAEFHVGRTISVEVADLIYIMCSPAGSVGQLEKLNSVKWWTQLWGGKGRCNCKQNGFYILIGLICE